MRKKEIKLIITFHTTTDAIAAERVCKNEKLEGRMIPVPREISAGCGLSFCTAPELEERMKEVLKELKIEWEDMVQLLY